MVTPFGEKAVCYEVCSCLSGSVCTTKTQTGDVKFPLVIPRKSQAVEANIFGVRVPVVRLRAILLVIAAALVDVHAALVVIGRIVSVVTLAVESTDSIRALAIRACSFNHRALVNINTDSVALGKTIIADAIVASLFVDAV